MEDIKQSIAEKDGFNKWEMMIKCYCTTDAGVRVINKHIKEAMNQAFSLTVVSNQRELLIAYAKWAYKQNDVWMCTADDEVIIDRYLSNL